ncbi:TatD family hydrolase [Flavobacterium soli]|uniref:TatD family hydrolase n=1 Tax=Flavobacterium soli TaxID=344881 RepID=UPI00047BEC9E|nr:TatD family hydrolase [Flavobacterium soli]
MHYFNLHTHHFTKDEEVLELVNQYPKQFDATLPCFSIGIHPWYIKEEDVAEELKIMEEKIQLPNCLAIGECGLDKRIDIPMELQVEVFEKQMALAKKYKMPVVLHCVAAFQELIQIKKRLKINVPMIIHGFSKNEQLAKQLLDNGFYISFGKYLIQNPELEEVFKSIPKDRFFLETDTIEKSIKSVYELAAKYKNITSEEVQNSIKQNFNIVFKNGRMD